METQILEFPDSSDNSSFPTRAGPGEFFRVFVFLCSSTCIPNSKIELECIIKKWSTTKFVSFVRSKKQIYSIKIDPWPWMTTGLESHRERVTEDRLYIKLCSLDIMKMHPGNLDLEKKYFAD